MTAETVEPSLPQFEPDRWIFPDEESRAEYVAAVEDLRDAMREKGSTSLHVRLLAQPTPSTVRAIARTLRSLDHETIREAPETAYVAPETAYVAPEHAPRRRWWQRKH